MNPDLRIQAYCTSSWVGLEGISIALLIQSLDPDLPE